MTVRLVLTIAALAGLAVLTSPAASISEARVLSLRGDAPEFWDPSADSRCCSVEDSALALGLLQDWKVEVEAPTAPDASTRVSGADEGLNLSPTNVATPIVTTDPETADQEAARVAAPPQSGLRRILSAVIDLGSAENSKR
jgi:hypothetical protein